MEINKQLIGLTGKTYIFEVEKDQIRKFAEAIGDPNPVYYDDLQAKKTMYGGIIAPPTFPMVISSAGEDLLSGLDKKRILHGEQDFTYKKVIRPGDKLFCQKKIVDFYERIGESGNLHFLVLEMVIKNCADHLVVTSRMNVIYRPFAKEVE